MNVRELQSQDVCTHTHLHGGDQNPTFSSVVQRVDRSGMKMDWSSSALRSNEKLSAVKFLQAYIHSCMRLQRCLETSTAITRRRSSLDVLCCSVKMSSVLHLAQRSRHCTKRHTFLEATCVQENCSHTSNGNRYHRVKSTLSPRPPVRPSVRPSVREWVRLSVLRGVRRGSWILGKSM